MDVLGSYDVRKISSIINNPKVNVTFTSCYIEVSTTIQNATNKLKSKYYGQQIFLKWNKWIEIFLTRYLSANFIRIILDSGQWSSVHCLFALL